MSSNDQVKVAIVGAGYMAREHIKAFQGITEVHVVGITSRTRTHAESLAMEYGIPFVCDSVPELYEKTGADLVVVAVSILSMNVVSKVCFNYPWTVLLEKPAGYNLFDAEDIEVAARKANSKAFVALNRRFYSSTQQALSQIKHIEGPRFIHVQDQEDLKRALEAGQPELVVENWMYANSIHLIDYFNVFGRGKITTVEPLIPWNAKDPFIVVAKITFESGDTGLYEGVWHGPGPWFVNINTTEKRWEMRPLEKGFCQLSGQRTMEEFGIHPWDQNYKPGLRLQAEEAVAVVQGKATTLPTLTDSLKSMQLVKAIFST